MDLIKAVMLGVIEGLTEFLPISSTGHLVLWDAAAGHLISKPFADTFNVVIQIGAIAAVVVYFRTRIAELLLGRSAAGLTNHEAWARSLPKKKSLAHAPTSAAAGESGIDDSVENPPAAVEQDDRPMTLSQRRMALLAIVVASLPLVPALLADKLSEKMMGNNTVIAMALLLGGVVMILIERFAPPADTKTLHGINWKQALLIGCAQIVAAVFPGTSRSAATIMAGMCCGLTRAAAAEFSFFLAIPAMSGAVCYKLVKYVYLHGLPGTPEIVLLIVGTVVSFLVAWAVIAALMGYIRRYNFVPFGVYRIVIGFVVLLLIRRGFIA